MNLALVFDPITQSGGAEQLLWALADEFTSASIFTVTVNPNVVPERFKSRIKVSWLQKFPFAYANPKPYLPFLPLAYESLDLSSFDKVISITTLFAKSIITKPETLHISYINSPPRFLYSQNNLDRYIRRGLLQKSVQPFFKWLKNYDQIATRRPDILVANSQNIKQKIKDIYSLDSKVIYPFAKDYYFNQKLREKTTNQFVIISRLEPWKRIDYAINAFNSRPDFNLIVIGSGSDKTRLQKIAKKNTSFTGRLDEATVAEIIASSQALIMTQEEDFGITAIEAQALGTPIVALAKGGVLETVIDFQTGLLYPEQTKESLLGAISRLNRISFQADKLHNNAIKYRQDQFIRQIKNLL